jgi:predicted ATPase
MLNRISVENFKGWKDLKITFGSVTGLFGTNSSGKSSILQFLLLLKQTKNATDRSLTLDFGGADQLVNLGSFEALIHRHNTEEVLKWRIYWKVSKPVSINDAVGKRTEVLTSSSDLGHSSLVRKHGKTLLSDMVAYRLGDYTFSIVPKKGSTTSFDLKSTTTQSPSFRFIRNKARAWALPGPIKTHLFPDQAKTYFQNSDFLSTFEAEYESMMDSIYYLGPLREYPRREYRWSGVSPSDVGWRGERTVEAILAATLRGEKRNLGPRTRFKSFQEIIAYWLKELGLIHDFKVEELGSGANLYQAIVKKDSKSPTALLTDVGFGVSQVLPALVLMYYVPEGSVVLMEQPEIHLHPAVQSGLADVILNVARARNLQIVVESHSEHMIRRFQRRVAEGKFESEKLKLYFCDSVGGESELLDLELDIFGEIKNWPSNFFGDDMTEIAETRKAILRRKIKEGK